MKKLFSAAYAVIATANLATAVRAGPYTEAPIAGSSTQIAEWASSVLSLTRGPQDIANPTGPVASYGSASDALGPADGTSVVSLGDGGQITLAFKTPIANGPGADFAVFENAFQSGGGNNVFGELGYVDVSSDGTNFFRFPSVSLTQTTTQVGPFGTIDPTNIHNLAGKDLANTGTQFDLSDLIGVSSELDVNHIIAVRVTDVVGRITPVGTFTPSLDSLGNIINDPYATPFASCGFDLDAIAVMNEAPEPSGLALIAVSLGVLSRRRRIQ